MQEADADQPLLSGTRQRKKPDVVNMEHEQKALVVPEGKGVKLADIDNVAANISAAKKDASALKMLHNLFFGKPGKTTEVKAQLLQFNGLVLDSDKQRESCETKIKKWKLQSLKECMDLLDVPRGTKSFPELDGKQADKDLLVGRLLDWLADPQPSGKKRKQAAGATKKKRKKTAASKSSSSSSKTSKIKAKRPAAAAASSDESSDSSNDSSDDDDDDDDFVKPAAAAAAAGSKSKKPAAAATKTKAKKPAPAAAAEAEGSGSSDEEATAPPPKKKAKASAEKKPAEKKPAAAAKQSSSSGDSSNGDSSATGPSTEVLKAKVAEIMASSEVDKDAVTFKQFNAKLEQALGVSLTSRKSEIKELLLNAMS